MMIFRKTQKINLILFIFIESLVGCYVIYIYGKGYFNPLLPIGIFFIVVALLLLLKKHWVRMLNIIYSAVILVAYSIIYWDLLLRRGFITQIDSPFFLMGFIPHLPVIVFNIIAIIFLARKKVKACFK